MKRVRGLIAVLMVLAMMVSLAPAAFAAGSSFGDVSASDWYYTAVSWAVENGITSGIGGGNFGPNNTCTRGQVVTFLWKSVGAPAPTSQNENFVDVDAEDWYYQPVLWAVENGVTGGTSATTFSPDAPCSRAQVATFLYAAQGRPAYETETSPFADVQPGDWYYDPVLWAVENGVTGGVGGGLFGSEQSCTRGQIATFLYKTDEVIGGDTPVVTPAPTPAPTPVPTPAPAAEYLSVSLASEPATLDPTYNSALDSATIISHLFSGLAKWDVDENGNPIVVADGAEALVAPVRNADGTVTYTYQLRDMKWSDGVLVTAYDYEYAWKKAADPMTGADYGYLLDVIKGYPYAPEVEALGSYTLRVTLNTDIPYWNDLLTMGVMMPLREDVAGNGAWASEASTYVSNGLYTMESWEHDDVIVLTKNELHPDADSVTMPELRFQLSRDGDEILDRFEAGEWLMIDNVPEDRLSELWNYEGFREVGVMGTYYYNWNVNSRLLPASSTLEGEEAEAANAEIRKALSLLPDRNFISEEISGQVAASTFVAMGMTDGDNTPFYENANSTTDDFVGYYDVNDTEGNRAWAMETLKKYYSYDEASGKFTDAPTLSYIYNESAGHKLIAEYIQMELGKVGISVRLSEYEWATFLNVRKSGVYDMARNGWIADYNDPICFLDMWTTESGNNDVGFGMDEHAKLAMYDLDLTPWGIDYKVTDGTWAETYDMLIGEIKNCTDRIARYEMMHLAEDMLMDTGCVVPLYYYTDVYMVHDSLQGLQVNPLGYKFFAYTTVQ